MEIDLQSNASCASSASRAACEEDGGAPWQMQMHPGAEAAPQQRLPSYTLPPANLEESEEGRDLYGTDELAVHLGMEPGGGGNCGNGGNGGSLSTQPHALVIDGAALAVALPDDPCRKQLALLMQHCQAVVACRATPGQKAEVMKLVREYDPAARTLAIGDGANDVRMIQTAHVGVGISGLEGREAVNSSDYAIGQFRFLRRLLLVHGRYNYLRITKCCDYMFYKNIIFNAALCWYAYFTEWSGTMAGLSQAELLASLEHFNQLLSGTADGYGNVPESVKNDAPRLALAKVRSAWADASCHCAPCFTHLWQHCLQAAGRTLRMRTRAHSPCTRITAPPLFAAQTPSRAGSVGTPSLASSSLLHTSLRRAHSGSNSHSRTGSGGGGRNSNGGGNRNTASSASDPLLAPGM